MPEEPPPSASTPVLRNQSPESDIESGKPRVNVIEWAKNLFKGRVSNSNSLREALEEYIEVIEEEDNPASADSHKALVTNVLKTRDLTVSDIMIPRADIVAIDITSSFDDLKSLLVEKQFSRLPVFRENLDDVIGTIHIKDILAALLAGKEIKINEYIREVPIVSPSMPLMDLMHLMREGKKHMALVVDEYGGIDGLVTVNDVIEAMIGDIEDEFDEQEHPQIVEKQDGSLIVDARVDIEEFEDQYGQILTEDERDDVETLGGLAFSLAGRVPARGELLKHASGMIIEVLDGDARRVSRLRLRGLPTRVRSDDV